jgi:hypothetical protein
MAFIEGDPGADVSKNKWGFRLAEDKGKRVLGSHFTLKGPAAPRGSIGGLLDGKNLFEILFAHPSY